MNLVNLIDQTILTNTTGSSFKDLMWLNKSPISNPLPKLLKLRHLMTNHVPPYVMSLTLYILRMLKLDETFHNRPYRGWLSLKSKSLKRDIKCVIAPPFNLWG